MQKQKNNFQAYSQVFIASKYADSKKIYAKRRHDLMQKLDSFCVFAGMQVEPGCEEPFVQTWTKMVQEPAFLYLTGVNQAGCYLVLDPSTSKETLFVPVKNPFKEFWVGRRIGYVEGSDEVSKITGIADVRPVSGLWDYVESLARRNVAKKSMPKHAYAYFFETVKDDHNYKLKVALQKKVRPFGLTVKSCEMQHFENRLVLEDYRVKEACAAQKATELAFREMLAGMRGFKTERDLSQFLDYGMRRRGDGDLAFPTICAGGANACCLHYVKNDEPLRQGELVLLDFGVRIGTLHSDISRTVPVNGKFDPLQTLLYQIVLDAGEEYRKAVKPGVSLKEIGNIPWEFIMEALDTRLVRAHSGKFELLYDKRPHGVSHFIGEQIHEGNPGSRSLDTVLRPGMLISCEPGLYGEFSGIFNGKRLSAKIGIRIEDDLLITKTGSRNISSSIPKSVEELERLMRPAR